MAEAGTPPARLVFCISSGRAGSHYLAGLLGSARAVHAEHEGRPPMTGIHLQRVMHEPPERSRTDRWEKVEAIRRCLDRLPSGTTYAETNHMFVKTFHDVILEGFADASIDVIVLRRELADVLHSFISMGYFSARNRAWPDWMHTPGMPNALVDPVAPDTELDQYDLAIGYLLDIEARAQRFVEEHPEIPTHEVRLEQLQDLAGVERLLGDLSLAPTPATHALVGRRSNERRSVKSRMGVTTSRAACHERIDEYLRRATELGVALPQLPQHGTGA